MQLLLLSSDSMGSARRVHHMPCATSHQALEKDHLHVPPANYLSHLALMLSVSHLISELHEKQQLLSAHSSRRCLPIDARRHTDFSACAPRIARPYQPGMYRPGHRACTCSCCHAYAVQLQRMHGCSLGACTFRKYPWEFEALAVCAPQCNPGGSMMN